MEEINFYGRKPLDGFMSNFHRRLQTVETEWGIHVYSTNEHFYQSMKANNREAHNRVLKCFSPYQAMMAGRALKKKDFKDNWDEIKIDVMLQGLRAKFSDPHLKNRLLATGDAILHEDSPTDMFWGKKGKDMLGKLLMQVRDELKEVK